MRIPWTVVLAAAAALLAVGPGHAGPAGAASPIEPCAEAATNLEIKACLAERVVQLDRQLSTALQMVQRQALAEPSPEFRSGWSHLLDSQAGGRDPAVQLQRFQTERRRICLYAQSISFQGSGYGGFVSSCELALTEALLQQLRGQ